MNISVKLSIEGLCDASVMLVFQNVATFENGLQELIEPKYRMCYFKGDKDIESLKSDLVDYPEYLSVILEFWGVEEEISE